MKWFSTGRFLAFAASACGILAISALPARAIDCPGNIKHAAQVSITLDFEGGKMTVDPATVTIFVKEGRKKPGRVCWVVQNLGEGQTLHIAGKEGEPDLFPNAEKTITLPRTFANSGNPAKAGKWMYELWITEEGKEGKLLFTDPEVIVEPAG
jgi:hypothetical protein